MEVKIFNSFQKLIRTIYSNGKINHDIYWNSIKEDGILLFDEEKRWIELRFITDSLSGKFDTKVVSYTEYFMLAFQNQINAVETVIEDLDILNTQDFILVMDFYNRIQIFKSRFQEVKLKAKKTSAEFQITKEKVEILTYLNNQLDQLTEFMLARIQSHNLNLPSTLTENILSGVHKNEKLKLELTVEEIACLFRLLKETHIINEENSSKITRVLTNAFDSKKSDNSLGQDHIYNVFTGCLHKKEDNQYSKTFISLKVILQNLQTELNKYH